MYKNHMQANLNLNQHSEINLKKVDERVEANRMLEHNLTEPAKTNDSNEPKAKNAMIWMAMLVLILKVLALMLFLHIYKHIKVA